MAQLNINVTPEFERDLKEYMQATGLKQKSEALRHALRQAVEGTVSRRTQDYREWLGQGLKAPLRRKRRFASEDDLWS